MIYELRTYELFNHSRDIVHKRFQEHTLGLMEKHGFRTVGFWDTVIGDQSELVYMLAWKDLNERQICWENFTADSEWIEIRKKTTADHGQVIWKNNSKILKPTPYSPLQ